MKILQINKFLYPKGGDAIVCLETGKLLESRGHKVSYWGMAHEKNLDFIDREYLLPFVDYEGKSGILLHLKQAGGILYNFQAKALLEKKILKEEPDVIHLHNFAHQISPSILHTIKKYKIPMVMTMHDYKLVCASYRLLSKRRVCKLCKGSRYYHCLFEKCVKDSAPKSLLNTIEMYLHHAFLHLYDLIDIYISPSHFLKSKLEEMGFKKEIVHLPNFISVEEYLPSYDAPHGPLIYVGRLSQEKGIRTLIDALKGLTIQLKIAGDGPIRGELEYYIQSSGMHNVTFLGYLNHDELKREVARSTCVVIPSEWYENNPLSIIEAFALGKPVIGSRMGGIPELVSDKVTGVTFEPGNTADIHSKIEYISANPDKVVEMGKAARQFVEQEFNKEKHYARLIEIYQQALENQNTKGNQ